MQGQNKNDKLPINRHVVDFDDIDPENAKLHRTKRLKSNVKKGGIAALGLVKTIVYLGAVILVSVILAFNIISIVNDVYAFDDNKDISVTIDFKEGTSLSEAAKLLKKEGIIKHPFVFKLYANREIKKSKYYTGEIVSGPVTFTYKADDGSVEFDKNSPINYIQLTKDEDVSRKPLNYDRIVSMIAVSSYKARETVRVTIPEGYTVDEIIELLTSNGVGQKQDYINAIQNHDYNYRFVKEIPEDPDRKYRLEGYLFPDTYEFFTDENEISVINKMLSNFQIKFEEIYYERAAQLGMSVDDLVILASILEKEAKNPADLPLMSSVFHNRLKASMRLDSDATVVYLLDERKVTLTTEDLAIDSKYNTRKYKGVPPGAISNPGIEAINAAFYPETTKYYYFLTPTSGETVYSRTEGEHNAAKNKARSEGKLAS